MQARAAMDVRVDEYFVFVFALRRGFLLLTGTRSDCADVYITGCGALLRNYQQPFAVSADSLNLRIRSELADDAELISRTCPDFGIINCNVGARLSIEIRQIASGSR